MREPFGLRRARHRGLPGLHHGQRIERRSSKLQLAEGTEGDAGGRPVSADFRQLRQLLGLRIRERLEQDGIDGAEDRGGGADTEG